MGPPSQGSPLRHVAGVWQLRAPLGFRLGVFDLSLLQTSSFLHPNACLQNQPDSRFRFGTPRAAVGLGLRFGHKVQLWRHQRFPLPAPQSLPRGSSSSRPGFIFEEEAFRGERFTPKFPTGAVALSHQDILSLLLLVLPSPGLTLPRVG